VVRGAIVSPCCGETKWNAPAIPSASAIVRSREEMKVER
jgi:hypothetical protein